ncbi:MAG: LLM class F420-dependent oxidoreductase [Candidatus Bathyarchaeota archaeon]|nr:LLM class F420-dependent oxidoreductase [Candidatus Bathyarchaeota archaeon]MDH5732782.1 LLM class F420-dependent oxidoreductase [Candidatus Bathyarchaeota archaeon]
MSVKFGIQIEPQLGFDYESVEKIALQSEKSGYDSIWSSDHFFLNDTSEDRNCMEAWTLLAALASKTEKIRLGPLVTCNSYRYPAVLAKIAATIDVISNGRLFFGIGAGWKKIEYRAYGIPFPPLKGRMDQLEEAIQIIKLLWTEPKATFKGKYFKIKDAFSAPKPVQKPTPPILIGGGGEKRTLKIVAKYADYCNLSLVPNLKQKLEVLKAHCKAVGRDYEEVGKSLFAGWPGVFVTESQEEIHDHLTQRSKRNNISIEKLNELLRKDAPGSWVGYPEEVIDRFQFLIGLGFDYFQVMFPGINEETLKASRAFTELVMKKL